MTMKRPWRLEVLDRYGKVRTMSYTSEGAARRAAHLEHDLGAKATRVYRRLEEEDYR